VDAVMAVRPRLRRETRDDHVRPEGADHADDVSQDCLPVPDPQGVLVILRKSEVFRAREVLPSPIQTPGGEQFLGASYAQLVAELGPEQVLAAVASRERQIGRPVSTTARQEGDDPRVLVVRMRPDVQHAGHRGEAAQLLQDIGADRELGGSTEPGASGQQACAEGEPKHLAAAPGLPSRRRRRHHVCRPR
jgi:hypothetical protein